MTKATDQALTSIASLVIGMMEDHGANWTKPWKDAVRRAGDPISAKKRVYTGVNRLNLGLILAVKGFNSPVFGTYKQWQSLGAQVTKGQAGFKVIFFTPFKVADAATGKDKFVPCFKAFTVFNADQVENWDGSWIEEDDAEEEQQWNDVATADALIDAVGADIRYLNQNRAFYSPSEDFIALPLRQQFKDDSGFYGTAFHELVHWTGHETREARSFGVRFGSDDYAFEELIAELGAAMLSNVTQVDATPREDHAVYLNNWIKCLKDNPKAISKAASLAEKAVKFVTNAAAPASVEVTA